MKHSALQHSGGFPVGCRVGRIHSQVMQNRWLTVRLQSLGLIFRGFWWLVFSCGVFVVFCGFALLNTDKIRLLGMVCCFCGVGVFG